MMVDNGNYDYITITAIGEIQLGITNHHRRANKKGTHARHPNPELNNRQPTSKRVAQRTDAAAKAQPNNTLP